MNNIIILLVDGGKYETLKNLRATWDIYSNLGAKVKKKNSLKLS